MGGLIRGWRGFAIRNTIDSVGEILDDGSYNEIYKPSDHENETRLFTAVNITSIFGGT